MVQNLLSNYRHFTRHHSIDYQKEEKILLLKKQLAEKESNANGSSDNGGGVTKIDNQLQNTLTVNKDNLIVADFITGEGTSDSAYGGTSIQTRSSRASTSDIEFSESYL